MEKKSGRGENQAWGREKKREKREREREYFPGVPTVEAR